MDANEVVKERKLWVICLLLRGIELGLPRRELGIATTMPPINNVFEIITIFIYLYGLRML